MQNEGWRKADNGGDEARNLTEDTEAGAQADCCRSEEEGDENGTMAVMLKKLKSLKNK